MTSDSNLEVPSWLANADLASRRLYAKTVRVSFEPDTGRIIHLPRRRREKVIVLFELLGRFERGKVYSEPEVNEILGAAHPDFATLRRELIDYHWMERADGTYWVREEWPLWLAGLAGEVEPYESLWFANVR